MSNVYAIFKREFNSYFSTPIAYIFITVFLIVSSWLFLQGFFIVDQATMRGFFSILPWVFLFFVPAVTMRLWAEEKKVGTIELLMTFPLKDYEVVIGKYLASLLFLILSVLLTFPFVITVFYLGNPDVGPIIGGYLGTFLMGGAFLAIGIFTSILTKNQIIAFILGVSLSFALFIIGEDFVLLAVPSFLVPLFKYISLGAHFESIGRGVIDTRDLIYYLSVICFFLYCNIRLVEFKKGL